MGARTRGLANNVLSSGKLDATDAVSGVIPASNIANASLTSATTFGSASGGVPAVASDPPSPAEGDIWYNTTSGQIKFRAFVEAWSTGTNLPISVDQGGGVGTQTTALQFGGLPNPKQQTLSYDGTAWTALNPTGQDRSQFACFGNPSAAVSASGEIIGTGTNNSENWNGTSWTSGGNVSTPRNQAAGFGTQTAGAIAGGVASSATEEYNGTSWTSGGSLPSTRYGGAAGGTQTAGIHAVGQLPGSVTNEVLYYDGSAWSAQPGTANVARAGMQSTGAGTQTAFGIYGGSNPYTGSTEFWDGTSFTAASDLSTTRASGHVGKSGTPSAGIMFGGNTPPGAKVADVEEWTSSIATTIVG